MSFFKKMLSKIGIGAAKIDTVLDTEIVVPGGELSGIIKITGGNTAQSINKIDVDICCDYYAEETYTRTDDDDEEYEEKTVVRRTTVLSSFAFSDSFEIQPEEKREILFTIQMPLESPISIGNSKTWIETNLDIEAAIDKSDKDLITVEPNDLQQVVFNSLEELGFTCVEAENEESSSSPISFIQEFEFKAREGDFRGRLDELEIVFMNTPEELKVFMEIDRKGRGISGFFAELLDTDEANVRITINDENAESTTEMLYDIIDSHC